MRSSCARCRRSRQDARSWTDLASAMWGASSCAAEDGLIVVVCTINSETGAIVSGPDVVSRGFVYVRESEQLIDEARKLVYDVLENCAGSNIHDWGTMKTNVKDALSRLLYDRTRRSPMILPIIMEV